MVVYVFQFIFLDLAAAAYLDRTRWKLFKAEHGLKQERQLLEATQRTLMGMLSSIFDASCTCDANGLSLSRTPQLHALLCKGALIEPSMPLDFVDFASSVTEKNRLLTFFRHTAASSTHQATVIQASLCPRCPTATAADRAVANIEPQVRDLHSSNMEVTLYGIALPCASDYSAQEEAGRANQQIFVGVQFQQCPVADTNIQEFEEVGEDAFDGAAVAPVFDMSRVHRSLAHVPSSNSSQSDQLSMIVDWDGKAPQNWSRRQWTRELSLARAQGLQRRGDMIQYIVMLQMSRFKLEERFQIQLVDVWCRIVHMVTGYDYSYMLGMGDVSPQFGGIRLVSWRLPFHSFCDRVSDPTAEVKDRSHSRTTLRRRLLQSAARR